MKLPVFILLLLLLSSLPATATPPDLVCSGGGANQEIRFVIPLVTTHSSIYSNGINPMAAHHVELVVGEAGAQTDVEIYGDHMVAQWLLDGRVDLRFYLEEVNGEGTLVSYDLIIRTKNSGEMGLESDFEVRRGSFEFRAYSGSFSEGPYSKIMELIGEAECK